MLLNIAIGCALIIMTTFVHAAVMTIAIRMLKRRPLEHWVSRSHLARASAVAAFVLVMFLAGVLEAMLWAVTYLALGAMSDAETATYFSLVTYTTLGFGDVLMPDRWRLLSAIEAANGIIMFGWTTALVVLVVQRMYFSQPVESERAS